MVAERFLVIRHTWVNAVPNIVREYATKTGWTKHQSRAYRYTNLQSAVDVARALYMAEPKQVDTEYSVSRIVKSPIGTFTSTKWTGETWHC